MADLRISELTKSFGRNRVLDDVSFYCPEGAYVCLLGPSGCGKSTLLRIIAGLEIFDSGGLFIGGENVDDVAPGDRNIGLAFQNYALFPHLTVRENLAFPLRSPILRKKYSKENIVEMVETIAKLLHIDTLIDKPAPALSGGQKQRVALGRALVKRPEVLLLDEPITHLDARLRHEMRAELKLIHKKLGTTTVHVTHDQLEAMAIADQIILMRKGRIEQVGSPDDIYQRPKTTFVAEFIGDPPMSLLRGQALFDERPHLEFAGNSLALPVRWNSCQSKMISRDVVVGVRAESISLTDSAAVVGRVRSHEWVGREQQVAVAVGRDTVRLRTTETKKFHVDEIVSMNIDLSAGILFDADTGEALSH